MGTFRKFLSGSVLAVLIAAAPGAYADKKSEAFVEKNANTVLEVLNDSALDDTARSQKFGGFMTQFAHLPSIARRVLGAHGRNLSDAEFNRYYDAFQRYAVAVYEVQLDQFRGEAIRVTSSTDIDARRSQVKTLIKSEESGKDVEVIWDVLASQDAATYRVRDVGLNLNGSVLWLAQDQQAQFEAYLARNGGDVSKLTSRIDQMTSDLKSRKQSGGGSTLGKPSRGTRG